MARLTVSTDLRNRSSVLPVARVIFARGQDVSLDAVMAEAFEDDSVSSLFRGFPSYDEAVVAEYEAYGDFGGRF